MKDALISFLGVSVIFTDTLKCINNVNKAMEKRAKFHKKIEDLRVEQVANLTSLVANYQSLKDSSDRYIASLKDELAAIKQRDKFKQLLEDGINDKS